MKKKRSLEDNVKRQGSVLDRVWKKDLKVCPKRVSLYENKKCVGWVDAEAFKSLRKKNAFNVQKTAVDNVYRIMLRPIMLTKNVTVRTNKGFPMKKVVTIITYTQDQRRYVTELFNKGLIPTEVDSSVEKYVNADLKKAFTKANIRVSRIECPSP